MTVAPGEPFSLYYGTKLMAARKRWFSALLIWAIASCSDATAPAGTVVLTVSPDTIRLWQDDAYIFYTRSNAGTSGGRVLPEGIDVQTEVSSGNWQTAEDPLNSSIQFALRDAETPTDRGGVTGLWTARIPPGKYRLHYTYRLGRADGTPSGDRRVVDSNLFTVISQ